MVLEWGSTLLAVAVVFLAAAVVRLAKRPTQLNIHLYLVHPAAEESQCAEDSEWWRQGRSPDSD